MQQKEGIDESLAPKDTPKKKKNTGVTSFLAQEGGVCEDPRPHAWSMCVSCFCPCISLSRATPLGRARYQTSEFLNTSEFPTESPTHISHVPNFFSTTDVERTWRKYDSQDQIIALP